ncbi:MAG: stage II sporulation protein M [Tepidanaerobacteraceae bacterium]|nr:stage II sporulation protein M [Tepidanaerobacteraceae bacterium]
MNYFPRIFMNYFKKNLTLYVSITIFFIGGILGGSIAVNMMSDVQTQTVLNFINSFFANAKNIDVDSTAIFYLSISNNLKTAAMLCVLGLTIIGLPLILIIIFFRGFILGYTVGFFIRSMGIKGILFSVLSILPQNILIIPSIISIGVAAMVLSLTIVRSRLWHYSENFSHLLLGYFLYNFIFCTILVLAGLIEGYISPVFIRFITSYI